MSEQTNFYGIERVSPCGQQREANQYHPRYARSEWDKYLALERRRTAQGFLWLCLALACAVLGVYAVGNV